MKSRTKRGRVRQVANFLYDVGYRPTYPVDIKFVRASRLPKSERVFGWAEKTGRRGAICLVETGSTTTAILIDTYLHELAHHLDGGWSTDTKRVHSYSWARVYAKLITLRFDVEPSGIVRSYDYPERWRL